jgi:hypothetical protein
MTYIIKDIDKNRRVDAVEEILYRIFENLIDRVSGPMKFRLFLQPTMAIFFAVRSGLQDAKQGRPPYFWAIFTDPDQRREMLRDGWKAVGKVFILAIVLDVVYQLFVFRWIYPFEAFLVASILAIVPYLAIRGPANRITQRIWRRQGKFNTGKN